MNARRATDWILAAGPLLLFVFGMAYGTTLQTHANDAWIGLATGRIVLAEGEVPRTDPFSFTFQGQPWFNQNWLSHVMFYWLYDRIGPAAAVMGKWATCALLFTFMLLACRWRSGSWLGALIVTGSVAAVSRNFFHPRPDTVGLMLLAGTFAMLAWLVHDRGRDRWWPALLLVPWLLIWGCAHGSFVLGYGMLGLFVGCWFVTKLIRPHSAPVGNRQVAAVVVAVIVAVILTIVLGPYGLDNFTHPLKVAESKVFRTVQEWQPAWIFGPFPPVWGFWMMTGLAVVSLAVAWAVRLSHTEAGARKGKRVATGPMVLLFDFAALAIGLYMALWARRFGALYYIIAAPAILTWIVRLVAVLPDTRRYPWRMGLKLTAWLLAIVVGSVCIRQNYRGYVATYAGRPGFDLFERTIRYDVAPGDAIAFLARNELKVNILTRWIYAGPVMYHVPSAKVFIDGRSQQVYDEGHYLGFLALWNRPAEAVLRILRPDPAVWRAADWWNRPAEAVLHVLEETGTNAVLVTPRRSARGVEDAVAKSDDWARVLDTGDAHLYLRRDSEPLNTVTRMEREGRLWWPNRPAAAASRARLCLSMTPPYYERGLAYFIQAVEGNGVLGLQCYKPVANLWLGLGRSEQGKAFFAQQAFRFAKPLPGMDERLRQQLLKVIGECQAQIDRARRTGD